jgi:thiosulfate dehydrogenase
LPIFGLSGDFPMYSARLGAVISIEDRINSCMTRSMNGRAMPIDGPEMQALTAYLDFLSSGVPKGQQLSGHGSGNMPELDRAADPLRGAEIYVDVCLGCHRSDGAGLPRDPQALRLGYVTPPLWGNDSFNDGAGMARITNMANFVHSNMPAGADYLHPIDATEDAWESLPMSNRGHGRKRPASLTTFRTCSTSRSTLPTVLTPTVLSEAQHKYGPFALIRAEIARIKAEQEKASGETK